MRKGRTKTCGELRKSDVGQTTELCGWVARRRDHGGLIFIDLRDRYGYTQVVFDPAADGGKSAHALAESIRSEYVLWTKGKVRARPTGMTNANMPTGEVEVLCSELEIFSEAKTPPFSLEDDHIEVNESLRLKYRYLDLRRPEIQKNLLIRHKMLTFVREELNRNQFVEVETPILYKSTPEGARDFIVPSRLNQGTFYALPQSPQTLKQLLMISGMDRYYQIARCFRDEDLRADRQPEFSQIDIETSFLDETTLFPIMEGMVKRLWKEILGKDIQTPFKQMHYEEAMLKYGSDKPDVRFGLEIQDISEIFKSSTFQVFSSALTPNSRGLKGAIRVLLVKSQAEKFSRKDLDDLAKTAGTYGAKGLLWMKVQPDGTYQSPAAKFFSDDEKANLKNALGLEPGDLVLVVADQKKKTVSESLGAVRLELGQRLGMIPKPGEGDPAFLWVTHFPIVEYDDKENRYFACHHPFTDPQPKFYDDFMAGKNLDQIEASAYDLVLNGVEIAGGSLRIYRQDVQEAMFRNLGISPDEAKEKFGFFLEALGYGTPPHGGIAFGIERLTAILCGVTAIRDVMAFPKTQKGTCLMSQSPSRVNPAQLVELGVSVKTPKLDAPGGQS